MHRLPSPLRVLRQLLRPLRGLLRRRRLGAPALLPEEGIRRQAGPRPLRPVPHALPEVRQPQGRRRRRQAVADEGRRQVVEGYIRTAPFTLLSFSSEAGIFKKKTKLKRG